MQVQHPVLLLEGLGHMAPRFRHPRGGAGSELRWWQLGCHLSPLGSCSVLLHRRWSGFRSLQAVYVYAGPCGTSSVSTEQEGILGFRQVPPAVPPLSENHLLLRELELNCKW